MNRLFPGLLAVMMFVLSLIPVDGGLISPVQAGYDSYKACYNKCTKSEENLTPKCKALNCGKLKGKTKKQCLKLCGMKEGVFDYCKASCTKHESCLGSRKVKSCLKICGEFRRSDIRKYQVCGKECKSNCTQF